MKKVDCSGMRVLVLVVAVCVLARGRFARADFIFGEPTKVPNINTSSADVGSLSPGGLELYIASSHPYGGDECHSDIYVATRPTVNDAWGTPTKLGPPVNSDGAENDPCISADGLELYFNDGFYFTLVSGCTWRANGYGGGDLWVSTRLTRDDPWGDPENLGPNVNDSDSDSGPSISSDGLSLYFHSYGRAGSHGFFDLYVTTRPTKNDPWGPAENLGPLINSSTHDLYPIISPDDLSLYFSSGTNTTFDIYVSRRSSTTAPWEAPVPFDPVNSSLSEYSLTFASGCSTLYFVRGINWNSNTGPVIAASNDIWQVEVTPAVDLNSDGIVDAGDMRIMIDHWHTNEPLCDIAPPPLGDRFVDVQDLIVLAEHLFEDYRLIAHWKMDEETGDIAHDSAGAHDATLQGQPTWQPVEGILDGALRLNGIADYVSTRFVLDPGEVSFSVTAWIKGGAPGQVIVSQADITVDRDLDHGSTWLGANSPDGKLTTGLSSSLFGSLESDSVIADGQWHHVGLVYDRDGLRRQLYVDGAEVVQDATAVPGLVSGGGLYIGAGQGLAPATFFSGLVDDVRIYNAALTAEEIAALAQ